jgi:hypothetical protein
VYDIWLVDCKGGTEVIAEPKEPVQEPAPVEPVRQQSTAPAPDIMAPPVMPPPPGAQVDVAPPQGVPVQPRQQPRQRFFPTNQAPLINTERMND